MPTIDKFKSFIHSSIFDKWNVLSNRYYELRTQIIYKPSFRHIGKKTVIRKTLYISNPKFISIGSSVSIRDGARLEVLQLHPSKEPILSIGDNTNIEQNVHIVCHNNISIGSNVSITGNCSIVDVTHSYKDIDDPQKIGSRICDDNATVEIGDNSFIGMGSIILPNVRIGKYVVIGANSVVSQDIPDYSVAVGSPARVTRRFDHQKKRWESVDISINK
jgi:acetyltransferase-like isoleucine patch superfamily enzyme